MSAAVPAETVAKWRPYPAYKDSGVEWLGSIPIHWDVKQLKRVLVRNDGGVWGDEYDEDGVIVLRSTDMKVDGTWDINDPARRRLTRTEHTAAQLKAGDLVLTKSSGSELHLGKTAIVTLAVAALDCCFSNFMQRLRLRNSFFPEYLYRLLNCPVGREQFNYFGSTTTGLANLNSNVIGSINIPCPGLPEQRAIASFLDRETAKIDALVVKKERLIELLQEKRTAIINQAVTKGLDPTVPMKESSVEWLGEIPAHWDVKKIKRLCQVKRGASPRPIDDPIYFDDEGEYAWVRISDVTVSSKYLLTTEQRLSELGRRKSVSLNPGELFVSIAATVGKPIIASIKCCIHDGFVYFVNLRQNREFLYYLFFGGELYKGLGKLGTQLNLNTDTIGDIKIALPPLGEQQAIVGYLDRETAKLDALIAKVREHIEKLREYRTALISAAVTGKIDVQEEMA